MVNGDYLPSSVLEDGGIKGYYNRYKKSVAFKLFKLYKVSGYASDDWAVHGSPSVTVMIRQLYSQNSIHLGYLHCNHHFCFCCCSLQVC